MDELEFDASFLTTILKLPDHLGFVVNANKVLNKVDLISNGNLIKKLQQSFPDSVTISAKNHLRLSDLKQKIITMMESNYETVDLKFTYDDGKTIAQVQEGVEVLKREYEEKIVKLRIRGSKSRISQIMASLS